MNLSDLVAVLIRRWYVVLAGIVAMAAAIVGVLLWVPTNYQASAQVLFLLPARGGEGEAVNPLLNQQPGLATTVNLVSSALTSNDARKAMADDGFPSEYSMALDASSGALLNLTVQDTDTGDLVGTRDELLRRINEQLEKSQSELGAPPGTFIETQQLNVSSEPEALAGSKIRAIAASTTLVAVLTVVVAGALERARPTGRRRRSTGTSARDDSANGHLPARNGDDRPNDQQASLAVGQSSSAVSASSRKSIPDAS